MPRRLAGCCCGPGNGLLPQARKQGPSFSEEKEAKRLCSLGVWAGGRLRSLVGRKFSGSFFQARACFSRVLTHEAGLNPIRGGRQETPPGARAVWFCTMILAWRQSPRSAALAATASSGSVVQRVLRGGGVTACQAGAVPWARQGRRRPKISTIRLDRRKGCRRGRPAFLADSRPRHHARGGGAAIPQEWRGLCPRPAEGEPSGTSCSIPGHDAACGAAGPWLRRSGGARPRRVQGRALAFLLRTPRLRSPGRVLTAPRPRRVRPRGRAAVLRRSARSTAATPSRRPARCGPAAGGAAASATSRRRCRRARSACGSARSAAGP